MAAKKGKSTATAINTQLLAAIGSGQVGYISKSDGLPLINHDPQLIEVNTEMLNEQGDVAVRLTSAGQAMINGGSQHSAAAPSEAKPSPYAVISNAVLPPSKRGNKGGGAPTQYPFDAMEIGQSFFVPVSEKHPDPVKTLGSTVSSANMRYAQDTGVTKEVTRTKRGPKNRALKNADGTKVKETVSVPVYKHTRKFSIRKVEKGVAYGSWTAPDNGALIQRVELKD